MNSAHRHYLTANWVELAGFVDHARGHLADDEAPAHLLAGCARRRYFLSLVFYRARLLSDALLQVFFIAFTLYGWWHWWRGVAKKARCASFLSRSQPGDRDWLRAAVGQLRARGTGDERLHAALPYLDAALTSYSLVGSWWQARKHIANWWLWIVVNLVYIGEYLYKDLWLTAVLYAGLVDAGYSWPARLATRRANASQMAACTTLRSGSPAM